MSNNKKYVSLSRLQTFLEKLSNKFAPISHKHKLSDVTDYKVDTALSSTSNNPIANSTVDAEFDAVATAINALDLAIDGKASASHSHDDKYYTESEVDTKLSGKANATHSHAISEVTNLQSSLDAKVPTSRTINSKPLTANVTLSASDVGAAPASHSHDDKYYTETEIDTKLAAKSDTTHKHDDLYDEKGAAKEVSDTLKSHTDNTNIHVTTSNKSNWNSAYTHSTSAHARTDATKVEDSTTNGNIKINGAETNVYSHPNSGATAGTYKSVTVNAQGHVTGGSNPTTLSGFGITDGETKSDASAKLTEAKTYTDTVASTKADSNHNHNDLYDTKSAVNTKIDTHNTSTTTHNDIRNLISGLTTRLNTLADSDDTTLDQLSEIVNYIKNNKSLIDGITTNKVNVADIINNLTTNVSNKPLSAAQGVAIKALIDDLQEELDSHDTDIVKHITSDERTDWNTAKTLAENALPTSGGTMTGAITMTQANLVKRDKDTSNVAIYGGTDSANGATITVYGKKQAIYPGYFSLKANNGEASASLEGRPDGTLKWNGKNIVALGTSEALPISSGGTGATKASDALENLGGLPKSNPSVTGSFSMNKLHSSTTGLYSVVEGYNCSATGDYGAHAEGYYSEANGDNSHAEGDGAIANGVGAHAEGYKTIASEDYSHVQGKYNIEDTENQYAHIVGNGTSNSNRSNAHTLDWDGNAWFAGNVYVGGSGQDDESAIKLATINDVSSKQDAITGTAGQFVVIGTNGKPTTKTILIAEEATF